MSTPVKNALAGDPGSPETPDPTLRLQFAQVAETLPVFRQGLCPPRARDYLAFYGLDLAQDFPAVQFSLGTVSSGVHRLALHAWQLPGATRSLLLVHGYFDHVGLYDHLVRFGLEQGFNVLAFDLPGHGLSSGAKAEIEDFCEYRQAIADVLVAADFLPGPCQVIAQSTGGAAVMDYLQSQEEPALDKVVLLAPLVRPSQWLRIRLMHSLLRRFVKQVPRGFADSSQDREFLAFVRRDPLQSPVIPVCWVTALRRWIPRFLGGAGCNKPVLVIQGDADDTVDWRFNLAEVKRLFPAMELHMVPSGRHHLANELGGLRDGYLERIAEYLQSC